MCDLGICGENGCMSKKYEKKNKSTLFAFPALFCGIEERDETIQINSKAGEKNEEGGEQYLDSFGELLYTEYYNRIYRYFSFRLFDKCEAEDLAQTVFLKIFTSLKKGVWEGAGDLRYIFTVARNTLIDYFRRGKHASIVSNELVDAFADSVTSTSGIEEREQREHIATAMQGLRAEEVRAVSLRFFADMEYPAIAKVMDKREDAVRQLVHRGLKSLRANLQPI